MTIVRSGVYFAMAGGVGVPLVFIAVQVLLGRWQLSGAGIADFVQGLQLLLWPSSFFMMATAGHELYDRFTLEVLAISVTVNAVLYTLVGVLIWVGMYKDARWLLYVVPGGILWGWYKLLQDYDTDYWPLYVVIASGILWGYYKLVRSVVVE